MNPFEQHGIYNVSPSQCNLFASSQALWVMERLLKLRSPGGAPMFAGTAVESGIVSFLNDASDDPHRGARAVEVAMTEFRKLAALSGDPRKEKYLEAIPKMVAHGASHLKDYGKPSGTQGKVEYKPDGLTVPFIGYYDIAWDNHGCFTDIKTTMRMPSEIKLGHARQVALYQKCISDNMAGRVTYVTDKKVETYELENGRDHLDALVKIAFTMQRFLSLSKDPHELAALVVPDYESFYWNDKTVRAHAFDTWGF